MSYDDDRDRGTDFPRLKGQCPACGNSTLFRGSQGYITCSWLKCPNPGAGHDAVAQVNTLLPDVLPTTGYLNNVTAWKLAEALNAAMSAPAGDPIDRGLATVRVFAEHGFRIVRA